MNPIANLPPQPIYYPGDATYASRFNEWVGVANGAMTAYRAEYEAAMAEQGIRVSWDTPQAAAAGSPFSVPPTYNATLTKDGFSTVATVSIGRAQSTDPRDLAGFDQAFNLKYQAQTTSPNGQLPSTWYAPQSLRPGVSQIPGTAVDFTPSDEDERRFYEVYPNLRPGYVEPSSVPGPATTTPVNHISIQPNQAPAVPDAGTIVTAPTTQTPVTLRYNLWEWNWFYETETGRVGPPPEAVGIADPRALMTRDEWWAKVAGWYANTPASGTSGGTSGGGGTVNGTGGTTITDPVPPGGGSSSTLEPSGALVLAGVIAAGFILARLVK